VSICSLGFVFELELARLRAEFDEGNPVERRAAIRAVRRIDSSGAALLLREGLDDEDSVVRLESAEALIERGDEAVLEKVTAWFDLTEQAPRIVAAHAVARFAVESERTRIERMLDDGDATVRLAAVDAIDHLGHGGTALAEALEDGDPAIRLRALDALAHLRDPATESALVGATRDLDARVRASAIEAVGQVPGADATTIGLAGLEDRDPMVVEASVRLLGRSGDADVVSSVAAKLDSDDVAIATASAFALARLDYTAALPVLRARLGDARLEQAVVLALSSPSSPEAATACVRAMIHADASIRDPADRLIARCVRAARVDSATASLVVAELVAHPTPALARTLSSIDSDDAIRIATTLAIGADAAVSMAALEALDEAMTSRPDGRVVDPLAEALSSLDSVRRALAIRILGRAGATRALAAIRASRVGESRTERDERLIAVARLAPAEALAPALRSLEEESRYGSATLASVVCDVATSRDAVARILSVAGGTRPSRSTALEALACGLVREAPSFVERRAAIVAAITRGLESDDSTDFAASLEAALRVDPALLSGFTNGAGTRAAIVRSSLARIASTRCDAALVRSGPALDAGEHEAGGHVLARFADGADVEVTVDPRGRLPRDVACAVTFERAPRNPAP